MHPTFGSRTNMLVSSANQGYGVRSGYLGLLPSEKSSRFGTYELCSQLLVHDMADLTDHGGPPTPAQGGRRRATLVAQNT